MWVDFIEREKEGSIEWMKSQPIISLCVCSKDDYCVI